MSGSTLFTIAVFDLLLLWTVSHRGRRRKMLSRDVSQWGVDLIGLTLHGIFVPVFQMSVVYAALNAIVPHLKGSLNLSAPLGFLLSFVVIDYAYYWNHRLLHSPLLWRFHSVHHSGETFDVFTTSRNSLWTTFLILYIWVSGALIFLLKNPDAFAYGVALGNALDIMRHAGFEKWFRFKPLTWVISPRDHAWHHSRDRFGINFGGNLNLWDRLHGSYHDSDRLPEQIGGQLKTGLWSAFWKGAP